MGAPFFVAYVTAASIKGRESSAGWPGIMFEAAIPAFTKSCDRLSVLVCAPESKLKPKQSRTVAARNRRGIGANKLCHTKGRAGQDFVCLCLDDRGVCFRGGPVPR